MTQSFHRVLLPLLALCALGALCTFLPLASATQGPDTLPSRLSDGEFWDLSAALSEPAGFFSSENVLSNESGFAFVIPELQRKAGTGGVYLGVGPEQNFSYIAALRPRMAFIIDIRRENLLEHLLYKALFELSTDRLDFVSRLFSRPRPKNLPAGATARQLLDAIAGAPIDKETFPANFKEVENLLTRQHRFALRPADFETIQHLHQAFRDFGPRIDYYSTGRMPGGRADPMPTYFDLMTETDANGRERSFLADEQSYGLVRDLQVRNLIVPVVGDFGGPSAIRAVGRYLKEHQAVVNTFYLSNVESYLFRAAPPGNPNGGAVPFYNNVRALPMAASSTFVRSIPLPTGRGIFGWQSLVTESILETLRAMDSGRVNVYSDLYLPRASGVGR